MKMIALYRITITIFIFLLIKNSGIAQSAITINELKKYSYLIYGEKGQFRYSATGFFIKKDSRLFLVGAGHTFNGKNTITGDDDPDYPDEIFVVICKECESNSGIIKIDISQIKKNATASTFAVKPEIFLYEIKNKLAFEINTIEKFVKSFSEQEMNQIDCVFMFGYPLLFDEIDKDLKIKKPILSFGNILQKYSVLNYYEEINTYDSINYLMKPNLESQMGGGFSGSPCFFNIKNKYYFGGICIGGSINKRLIIIVRPEQLLKQLN